MNDQLRRIYSRVTHSSFLHIEDALHMLHMHKGEPSPKLRFFGAKYGRQGDGMDSYVVHYVDLAAARVLVADLTQIHTLPEDWDWVDHKGGNTQKGVLLANRLEMNTRREQGKRKLFLTLKLAPGERDGAGIVKPIQGRATVAEVTMRFDLDKVREMAYQVQAYLQAAETCRLWAQLQAAGAAYPGYPLSQRNAAPRQPHQTAVVHGTGETGDEVRRYGDGTAVPSRDKRTLQVFDWYKAAHDGRVPRDAAALADWWDENRNDKQYQFAN